MCQKSSSDKNMYTHNLIEIDFEKLEKLLRNNARTIAILRITGGEPFLYSDFEKLIDLLNEINLKYSILTNGSLIDDKIAQKTADRLGITIRWNSQILYFSKEENQIISNRNPVVGCIDFFFSGIITPDFKFKICPLSNPISDLKDGDLQRLWNGVEINEGRKMIQKNNFPSTCRYCPDYNEHFNETGKEYSFIDYQKRTHYWKL